MPFIRQMNKENVLHYTMEYYSYFKIEIIKISGKWMEVGGGGNLPLFGYPERQIWYLVT